MFWQSWAEGLSTRQAARVAGLSRGTGEVWVQQAGGVRPRPRPAPSGRFLSFAEREEIATGWAAGLSCAEIARRLG